MDCNISLPTSTTAMDLDFVVDNATQFAVSTATYKSN